MKKLNSLTNLVIGLDGQPIVNQVGVHPDGKPILVPETVGRMMANVVARQQANRPPHLPPIDSVRTMMIAMQIHGVKSTELEDADFALVQGAVDTDPQLTVLGKAALLTALNGAKEK